MKLSGSHTFYLSQQPRLSCKKTLPDCARLDSNLGSSNLCRNCESPRVNNFDSATIELCWFHF